MLSSGVSRLLLSVSGSVILGLGIAVRVIDQPWGQTRWNYLVTRVVRDFRVLGFIKVRCSLGFRV